MSCSGFLNVEIVSVHRWEKSQAYVSKKAFWAKPPVLTEFSLVSPGHLVFPMGEESHNLGGEGCLSWTFIMTDKSSLIVLYCCQTCLVLDSHWIQGRHEVPNSLVGSYDWECISPIEWEVRRSHTLPLLRF